MARPRQMTPIEKIDQEIKAKKNELERLETAREIVSQYMTNGGPIRRVIAVNRKAKHTGTKARVTTILQKHGPLPIKQIVFQLKKSGWKSESKKPEQAVWNVIGKGGFKRTKPGVYMVKG